MFATDQKTSSEGSRFYRQMVRSVDEASVTGRLVRGMEKWRGTSRANITLAGREVSPHLFFTHNFSLTIFFPPCPYPTRLFPRAIKSYHVPIFLSHPCNNKIDTSGLCHTPLKPRL